MAIGPQTWFVDTFGANVSSSGTVVNNSLTGAFGYGIAVTSARNFTVEGNVLLGNTSFIGSRGPNCSASDPTPSSAAFIVDSVNVTSSNLQSDFQSVPDARGLTCVLPPDGGDYWPYGGNPSTSPLPTAASPTPSSSQSAQSSGGHRSTGSKVGLVLGIIIGVIAIIVAAIFVRRRAVNRTVSGSNAGFVKPGETF